MRRKFCTLVLLLASVAPIYSKGDVDHKVTKPLIEIRNLPTSLEFAGESVPINLPYVKEAIDREVLTTSCMHTSTMLNLRATKRYFPIIEPILKRYGVPDDFKYLCMAESGLNPNAVSPARAAGLWQFISSAAKEYGLETGDNTDMRYHIERSTEAACRYLLSSYEKFGSWTLAAASYNAGQAGVTRRLDIQGVDNYWDLYLPEETMRYIPRIISLKLVEQDPASFGFILDKGDYFRPYENYTTITVDSQDIDWSDLASKHNTNYRQLRILNPWIRSYNYENKSGTSYEVKIPTAKFKELGY